MKSELNLITDQFRQVYEGDPWYGTPVKTILDSIPSAAVFDPPAPNVHSVAELTAHIINWRRFLLKRLEGDAEFLPDQEETFEWKTIARNPPDTWEALKKQLADDQQRLLRLLEQQDDALLDQPVAAKPYTFGYLIRGVLQHDVYHLGQISFINRLYQERDGLDVPGKERASLLDIFNFFRGRGHSHRYFSYGDLSLLK